MPANPDEYTEKSAKLLRAFHRRLTRNGINSHLRFSVDGNTRNHIHIDAVRIKPASTLP